MRVQRVLMPGSEVESWTVLGEDQVPVEPVERFLAFLAAIERSPNTIKAYAHDLKDWFVFLAGRGSTGGRSRWRTSPGSWHGCGCRRRRRDGRVAVLPTVEHHCAAASVNRKLAALASFCEFHSRHGVPLAGLLTVMEPVGRRGGGRTSFKPFLHHVTKSSPQRRRTVALAASAPRPLVLTAAQTQAILDGCTRLRDRLLFAVLLDTGVRIGEALGLRHEDVEIAERGLRVVPRANDNRARAKAGRTRTIPASAELIRLYADYLNREYGTLDSDYVFVNLWGQPRGHPLTYPAVYDLVGRLRRRTGVVFGPHHFRHTYATWLLRRGAGMESVKELLGHASITTTIDTYGKARELHQTGENPQVGCSAGSRSGRRSRRLERV